MGPPTEPPPLCSSPLTRSLVLVLSLSVATRSSSLFVILPFFLFFFTQSLPFYYLSVFFFFYFSAVQLHFSSHCSSFFFFFFLHEIKKKYFKKSVQQTERCSSCNRKGIVRQVVPRRKKWPAYVKGGEKRSLLMNRLRKCISLPTSSNPLVPLVCFQTHFSPHCW